MGNEPPGHEFGGWKQGDGAKDGTWHSGEHLGSYSRLAHQLMQPPVWQQKKMDHGKGKKKKPMTCQPSCQAFYCQARVFSGRTKATRARREGSLAGLVSTSAILRGGVPIPTLPAPYWLLRCCAISDRIGSNPWLPLSSHRRPIDGQVGDNIHHFPGHYAYRAINGHQTRTISDSAEERYR